MNANVKIHRDNAITHAPGMLETHLISGVFNACDAKEQALKLVLDLQNYYGLRAFSHMERFGESDHSAEKTLQNLNETFLQLQKLFEGNESDTVELRLLASITVQTNSDKTNSLQG